MAGFGGPQSASSYLFYDPIPAPPTLFRVRPCRQGPFGPHGKEGAAAPLSSFRFPGCSRQWHDTSRHATMESSQEKSLPASERKLQKTREDGQGERSRDLSHLAILGAGAACLLVLAPQLMDHMQLAMSQQLAFDAATVMAPGTMLKRLQDMVVVGLVASAVLDRKST